MKDIRIRFINQADQKYYTVGNYGETENEIWFEITEFDNPNYSWAVMLHELVEKRLKDIDGVTDEQVDAWDLGPGKGLPEPGLDHRAPYHKHHLAADSVERVFIVLAGEDWVAYEQTVMDELHD